MYEKGLKTRDFEMEQIFGHWIIRPENVVLTVIGNIST